MKSKLLLLAMFVLIALGKASAYDPPPEKGKEIFSLRCAACHNVNKELTGPALAGVHERRSLSWIVDFVHSSQKMVKQGDKDAIALFEKFNKIPMPDHTDLTDENIKDVVEYIKSESKSPVVKVRALKTEDKVVVKYLPLSIHNNAGFFAVYLGSVFLLVAVLLFAVRVKEIARKG